MGIKSKFGCLLIACFFCLNVQAELVINEFMASNDTVLADASGEYPDWIELYNSGPATVNLSGWYLTDNANNPDKWPFPDTTVAAGQYLIIFASDKAPTNLDGGLHTNFTLQKEGEYLALVDTLGQIVQAYDPFPQQQEDYSYGLIDGTNGDINDSLNSRILAMASPGLANSDAFTAAIDFSVTSRFFINAFSVSLSSPILGATIRYTTDGSDPTSSSAIYAAPINISIKTILKARLYYSGGGESGVAIHRYYAINPALAGFSSDLPILIIDTDGSGFNSGSHTASFSTLLEPDPMDGRTEITDEPTYYGKVGYRIRGSSSGGFAKKQYSMELWDENNEDIDASLLGMPEESDWVLYAPGRYDRNRISNPFMYDLSNRIGWYAPRTRFVEVYQNTDGGTVGSEDYWGLYVLIEKIKRGKDRVDVEKLGPTDNASPEVEGGYMLSIDRSYEGQSRWSTPNQANINHVYPKWTQITPQQQSYIRDYVTDFDNTLYGANWLDPINGYRQYFNTAPSIDHHILKCMAHEVDMLRLSTYFYKKRGGRLEYGPVWDFDRSLESADNRDNNPEGWSYYITYNWWDRLFDDPEFNLEWWDRWYELRKTYLSTNYLNALIDSNANIIMEASVREGNRWNDGNYVYRFGGFAGEIQHLKDWLQDRCEWIDDQHFKPPLFNQEGGLVSPAFLITLTNPNGAGTIYYTLDGSDPRLHGGAIAPSAISYSGGFTLQNKVTDISARVKDGSTWSGLMRFRFYLPQDYNALALNEILYHPSDSCGVEFLEIKNVGSDTIDLTDCQFVEGIRFRFPFGQILPPDSFLVLTGDSMLFQNTYGFDADGYFEGSLDNGGELIKWYDPHALLIDSVKYNDKDPWDPLADGLGPSLELISDSLDNSLGGNWLASDSICGTPRAANSVHCQLSIPDIRITEINYGFDWDLEGLDAGDWIELYNPTGSPIDISNWRLQDENQIILIPDNTLIPAYAYWVLADSIAQFLAVHPGLTNLTELPGLALSNQGEHISLRMDAGCPVDVVSYDNKAPWPKDLHKEGQSLMLADPNLDNSEATHWLASGNFSGTPGDSNIVYCSQPEIPLVINEINYKSAPIMDAKDWVEIYNPNPFAVDLSNYELHDGNNYYRIPAGTNITGDGYLVVVQDPVAFNGQFPAVFNFVGGWSFGLGGDGEWLALLSPTRCWVDGLRYNDSPPWPVEPDGNGPSLSLIQPDLDNGLPGSWAPSTWGGALFGTPGGPNLIPDPCIALPTAVPFINEIHYNSDPMFDTGNWIELYHTGSDTLDLSGWLLMDEDSVFTFPNGTSINPGSFLVLAEDPTNANLLSLMSGFGPVPPIGPMGFQLNNKGERILMYSHTRCLVDSVDYNDKSPWPEANPDPTIALLDPALDNALGQSWTAALDYGSPGGPNKFPCSPGDSYDMLRLWLKGDLALNANDPVSLWPDASPFGFDATQLISGDEPHYLPDQINQHGVISFNGTTEWMKINQLAATLSGNSTVFTVFKPLLDTDDGYYLSTHLGGSNRIKMGHRLNGELIYDDDAPTMATGSFFDKWTMTTVNITISQLQGYVNGTIAPSWDNPNVTGADRASIGQEYDGQGNDNQTSNHWKAHLAEMIILSGTAPDSVRHEIETYLSLKFGLTIPVANHLYYDNPAMPYQMAGIGRDVFQCLDQSSGKNQEVGAIFQIDNPDDLQHGEFLAWAHNGGSVLEANQSLNVPPGFKARMDRVWHFGGQGEVGNVNASLDITATGWENYDPRSLLWLIDDDGDFSDAQAYPYSERIALNAGDYLTVAIRDHVHLHAKALLSGPYDLLNAWMWDSLRVNDLIPELDPYENVEKIDADHLLITGADAIVDWVQLEFRQLSDSMVIYRQSVLMQRDGGLIGADADTNLFVPLVPGDYFISIRHRNHLGAMLYAPISLAETASLVDFRTDSCMGFHPQKELAAGIFGLWAGDTNGDGQVSFQGGNNDPGSIFLRVLADPDNIAFARNFISTGYHDSDVNMDGTTIFQGGSADTSPIFIHVLSHPVNVGFSRNFVIISQLP